MGPQLDATPGRRSTSQTGRKELIKAGEVPGRDNRAERDGRERPPGLQGLANGELLPRLV